MCTKKRYRRYFAYCGTKEHRACAHFWEIVCAQFQTPISVISILTSTMMVFSPIRHKSLHILRFVPQYQRIQHVALSGSKRSGSDKIIGEVSFMLLRIVVRSGGRFIGYLWRTGRMNPKTVVIIAGVPVLIFGGLVLVKGEDGLIFIKLLIPHEA